MDVRFVSPAGVELYDAAELPALLARADGLGLGRRTGVGRAGRADVE